MMKKQMIHVGCWHTIEQADSISLVYYRALEVTFGLNNDYYYIINRSRQADNEFTIYECFITSENNYGRKIAIVRDCLESITGL